MTASIVIVTKDDPRVFDASSSALAQEATFPFDVHVVGEWTHEEIPRRLEERAQQDARLTVTRTEAPFMEAWNAAAQASEGEIVVRMDSDTEAEPGWLQALLAPLLEDEGLGWTAGKVLGPEQPASLTQRYVHERAVGFFERKLDDGPETASAPGWNVAYRRQALEAVKWYDTRLVASEDWDLHRRLTQAGYPGRLVPEAVLRHDHPDTVRELFAKEAWYKEGQIQMAHKHGLEAIRPVLAIPLAYAGVIGLLVAAPFWPPLGLVALAAWAGLALKHWAGARREGDAVWWARPFYRAVEGLAGLLGMARGLLTHGPPPWTGEARGQA